MITKSFMITKRPKAHPAQIRPANMVETAARNAHEQQQLTYYAAADLEFRRRFKAYTGCDLMDARLGTYTASEQVDRYAKQLCFCNFHGVAPQMDAATDPRLMAFFWIANTLKVATQRHTQEMFTDAMLEAMYDKLAALPDPAPVVF